jgi:hypothetical protein
MHKYLLQTDATPGFSPDDLILSMNERFYSIFGNQSDVEG